MKCGIAILVRTIGTHYEFGAALPEGTFLVTNAEEVLTDDDFGKPTLVRYEPADQFCEVITMERVEDALSKVSR